MPALLVWRWIIAHSSEGLGDGSGYLLAVKLHYFAIALSNAFDHQRRSI